MNNYLLNILAGLTLLLLATLFPSMTVFQILFAISLVVNFMQYFKNKELK